MLFDLVSELDADVNAAGAQLIVVVVPSFTQVYPELWARFTETHPLPAGKSWNRESPGRRIADFCSGRGLQVIDLLPGLERAARREPYLYYHWNGHWTPEGNRYVASIVLQELGPVAEGTAR